MSVFMSMTQSVIFQVSGELAISPRSLQSPDMPSLELETESARKRARKQNGESSPHFLQPMKQFIRYVKKQHYHSADMLCLGEMFLL